MELANSRGVITRLCDAACTLAIGTSGRDSVIFPSDISLATLRYACSVSQPRKNGEPGLCSDCRHARVIRSDRGSVFILCQLSASNPGFPKYPRLPVLTCSGYSPTAAPSGKPSI